MGDDDPVPILSEHDLREILLRAWEDARARPVPKDTRRGIEAERSGLFVCALGDALADHYRTFRDVAVFCHRRPNGVFLRREEFLFDVLLARMGTVPSPVRKALLRFVREPLLQVESEFAHDTRETVLDASKLVCGAARQSLVVVPSVRYPHHYLRPLGEVARCIRGEAFAAFVPHPRRWAPGAAAPSLYRWDGGAWRVVGS